jgi:hypothetical protein
MDSHSSRSETIRKIVEIRHTLPLLQKGFQVCAVEFEEQDKRPACQKARQDAQDHPNFSSLIWPWGFKKDNRKFDAALLCYVLQTMPVPKKRKSILRLLKKKLRDDAYLLWMSKYNQMDDASRSNRVSDWIYRWKEREHQTFFGAGQFELCRKITDRKSECQQSRRTLYVFRLAG